MAKKIGIGLFIAIVFGALLYATVYFWASHDEPYKRVEQTLQNSKTLQTQVGQIKRIRLAPFGAYDERTAGDDGWATMAVEITGTTKSITLDVRAKKTNGAWALEQASLDGKPFALN